MRRIFRQFAMVEQELLYTIQGGATEARELVISNLDQAEFKRVLQ